MGVYVFIVVNSSPWIKLVKFDGAAVSENLKKKLFCATILGNLVTTAHTLLILHLVYSWTKLALGN
jgi:hypothetical protein